MILLLQKLFVLKLGNLIKEKKINGIILAGDFNSRGIIWEKTESVKKIVPRLQENADNKKKRENFIKSVNESGLIQNIYFKTYIGTLLRDSLDLVFTDKECKVAQDQILGSSGHIGINWKYKIPIEIKKIARRYWIDEDWLTIKKEIDTKFKTFTEVYEDVCKCMTESQSATETAVNID